MWGQRPRPATQSLGAPVLRHASGDGAVLPGLAVKSDFQELTVACGVALNRAWLSCAATGSCCGLPTGPRGCRRPPPAAPTRSCRAPDLPDNHDTPDPPP